MNDGVIGIFQPDPDPITFLTTATIEKNYDDVEPFKHGNITYPFLKIKIEMTTQKIIQFRQAYTLFDLLGDFGGFNGSVLMILSSLMTAYSARIYRDQIAREIPLQRKNFSHSTKQEIWRLRRKLSNVEETPCLD